MPAQSSAPEDPEILAADAALLRTVLIFTLVLGLLMVVLTIALIPDDGGLHFWVLPCGLASLCVATLYLFQRKRLDATLSLFLWGFALLIFVQCALVNGIRTPVAAAFPVIAMLSAWSRSTRQTLWLCGAILLGLSGMALLEDVFWPIQKARSPIQYWAIYIFCMGAGSLLAARLASAMRAHHARQIRASAELSVRVRELQLAQEKFSTFFYLNPVPVSITLLVDGTYYDVNPAWENISGWRKAEITGKTSTEIGIWVNQSERDAWIAEFRQHGRSSNQLVRFRLRTGEIRHFVANCETIHYDGHKCIFAAFVDVTERREAEEALKQLNARLEDRVTERTQRLAEANQSLANTVDMLQRMQDELVHSETMASLGSMVAGISHELNTPIGNALTVVSSLQEQAREMADHFDGEKITRSALKHFITEQLHGAELAAGSLLRASELVASFKQVAVDQTSERRRVFDLAETLESVLGTLRPMLRFKPIELHSRIPANIRMDSYPGPLGQILSNLIQNALLHGLDGRPAGNVWVEATESGADAVQITVRDDGKGIDDEHLGRIFDPFFTTRLGQGGSGLGLAIVYRLSTALLGGSISVSSQPGNGASFTLTIPRVAPDGPVTQA